MLKISYRVRTHHMSEFEDIFHREVLPLLRERNIRFKGIWRTLVGNAGEYLELWEFNSAAEFEEQWKQLMADPRLHKIFESTGPMVEGENLALFEPTRGQSTPGWGRYSV